MPATESYERSGPFRFPIASWDEAKKNDQDTLGFWSQIPPWYLRGHDGCMAQVGPQSDSSGWGPLSWALQLSAWGSISPCWTDQGLQCWAICGCSASRPIGIIAASFQHGALLVADESKYLHSGYTENCKKTLGKSPLKLQFCYRLPPPGAFEQLPLERTEALVPAVSDAWGASGALKGTFSSFLLWSDRWTFLEFVGEKGITGPFSSWWVWSWFHLCPLNVWSWFYRCCFSHLFTGPVLFLVSTQHKNHVAGWRPSTWYTKNSSFADVFARIWTLFLRPTSTVAAFELFRGCRLVCGSTLRRPKKMARCLWILAMSENLQVFIDLVF